MAGRRQAPKPKPKPRRRASKKRQPKRILNVVPSPETDEDWTFRNAQEADMIATAPRVPSTKDLRADWWKINDQKSTGSCVGWATADSVLRWHFVKAGRLAADDDALAPLHLDGLEGDRPVHDAADDVRRGRGTSLKSALDIARKYGAVRDSALPWATGKLFGGSANTLLRARGPAQGPLLLQLGVNPANWRTWLATNGPILTRLDVDATWDAASTTRVSSPSTSRGRRAAATPWRSSATGPASSSSGTAGGPAGATRASRTPRTRTPRTRSPRPTASACRRVCRNGARRWARPGGIATVSSSPLRPRRGSRTGARSARGA